MELAIQKHTNLPHIDQVGYWQFVTIRTQDSIDEKFLSIADEDISKEQFKKDEYADLSLKGNYLNGEILQYLYEFLLSFDSVLYELACFCIMPNHVHILFKQQESLALIIKKLKGISAKAINKQLGFKGRFWEKGYYDKAIRNQKHFELTYRYIAHNALKIELKNKERFYGKYDLL